MLLLLTLADLHVMQTSFKISSGNRAVSSQSDKHQARSCACGRSDAATRERASSLRFTTRVCEGFIISKAQQALFINIDQDINSYEEQKVKYNNDKYRLTKSGFPFSSLTPRTAQRIINAAFQETFTSPSLRRRLLRSKQQQ